MDILTGNTEYRRVCGQIFDPDRYLENHGSCTVDMATPYSPTTIARFHTRLKLVWGQTDVGKGWLASQPWPAAVGRPCAAVRFLASERTEMLFSLIELSARGPLSKRVASHLRPPTTVPYRHPFRFLSYLHLSVLSLSLSSSLSPVESCPTRLSLPPLFRRESSSIHVTLAFAERSDLFSNNAKISGREGSKRF